MWEGPTYGGKQAFFNENEVGCKSMANINAHSVYNNTFSKIVSISYSGISWNIPLFPGQSENNYPTLTRFCIENW